MKKLLMRQELIDRLITGNIPTLEELENRYPTRPTDLVITRIAPSPTGFMHIGTIATAMINERLAHQNNGIFYLRIEDTDLKREVEGATEAIVKGLNYCGLYNDEGLKLDGKEHGIYGPYRQSERRSIYKAVIKELLKKNLAYPSFLTQEELDELRKEQTNLKIRTGLYGLWAKERNLTEEQIIDNLDAGKTYTINFKSKGNYNNNILVNDLVKGKRMLPENDLDVVILKSEGLPTYHFAHLVDDHFMGTTHVIRTDEWFISTPLHLQLFEAMNWIPPLYIHPAPIQKIEGNVKRKLSKRKDLEANFLYYIEQGYPKEVILSYLMNLLNSNYETWRMANPKEDLKNFQLSIENLGNSGAVFDFKKLDNICKDFIANLSAEELYARLLLWAKEFNTVLVEKMEKYKAKFISIFEIERKDCAKVRKDFGKLSEIYNEIAYFFEYNYNLEKFKTDLNNLDLENVKIILNDYITNYDENLSKDEWFSNLKATALKYNYVASNKDFNPAIHKGNISDFVMIFRYLITERKNSPDLYFVMKVLGKAEVIKRLQIIF